MLQRWCTGLILATLVYLAVMYLPALPFLFLTTLLFIWMCVEWVMMLGYQYRFWVWISCTFSVIAPVWLITFTSMAASVFMALMTCMALMGVVCLWAMYRYVRRPKPMAGCRPAILCMGLLMGMVFVLAVYFIREDLGREALLFLVGLVVVVDTMAYIVGRAIGKHPLLLAVSPGKTWEGCVGGVLSGALYFGIVGQVTHLLPITMPALAWPMGACLGVMAVWGDLLESMLKRMCGMKDSGSLLPGHGGILDRVDGMLLAVPVFLVLHSVDPILFL